MAVKMLGRDLEEHDQLALANMSHHPGFSVLVKLMDEACRQYAAEPLKLDPLKEDQYERKLKEAAIIARVANEFCESLRRSVNLHIDAIIAKQKEQEENDKLDIQAETMLEAVRRLSQ